MARKDKSAKPGEFIWTDPRLYGVSKRMVVRFAYRAYYLANFVDPKEGLETKYISKYNATLETPRKVKQI